MFTKMYFLSRNIIIPFGNAESIEETNQLKNS